MISRSSQNSVQTRTLRCCQIATTRIDLTPREREVLAALKLGLPNKLIAVKLNLSENTVKMHIQHIMRKCSAHNRTEAVLRWSERLTGHNGHARPQVPSSS